MGGVARSPLLGLQAVEESTLSIGTRKIHLPVGASVRSQRLQEQALLCFKGQSATLLTAEDWTPGDPQAPRGNPEAEKEGTDQVAPLGLN